MKTINAYAAMEPGLRLKEFTYEVSEELEADQVEIEVESCGICHSDLSMLQNQWGMSAYPMSDINAALEHLHSGSPRYRIVLQRK